MVLNEWNGKEEILMNNKGVRVSMFCGWSVYLVRFGIFLLFISVLWFEEINI